MISVGEARQYYVEADSAHGFDHVLRVLRLAERIGRAEGVDLEVLRAAALLHDVGRPEELRTGECHAQVSARLARSILALAGAERVDRVAQAIAEHRFRGAERPSSAEGRVLFDADKLDAIGVARAYAVAGAQEQHLWADVAEGYRQRPPEDAQGDLASGQHTPVHEYLFKLVTLRGLLYTDEGRRIAAHRHQFMVAFFSELAEEVRGER
ncbi:MAG: HD domain-containing protein [Chloroflexi bacterium]|jgi:uncharacterized protein|nr:HD domain-containing protein [Chloroflexota bacterium]